MTEMIDRVSKAIDAAIDRYFAEWEAKANDDPTVIPWIGLGDIPREMFARAAIEAMREPTKEMMDSALKCEDDYDGAYVTQAVQYWGAAYDVWTAMIEAALEEKPE